MDDTQQLKAEFPLGDLMIVVSEPSPGQHFALSLSRTATDQDQERLVRRVLKVMEALTGPEQWYGVIEDALISGTVTPAQLMDLAARVLQFPWSEHRAVTKPEPLPEEGPTPGPVPRIISGG